ncbi:hypothetical protein [Sinorhizobium saheli]|nr:hypothetical protein [Sinorhizobium saheli]MQW90364.1 hypothetical protein [Sinorhizobium saheli]
MADAHLFVIAGRGKHVGIDLVELKKLRALLGRVAALAPVQEALKAEGLG